MSHITNRKHRREQTVSILDHDEVLAILFAGKALSNRSWHPDYVAARSSERAPMKIRAVGAGDAHEVKECFLGNGQSCQAENSLKPAPAHRSYHSGNR